jgi:glycerate 2-kinase
MFCGAQLLDGARLVAELTGLEEKIRSADLVISGEGLVDAQTAMGKAPGEVARLARKHGGPVVYLAGSVSATMRELRRAGVAAAVPIVRGPISTEDAMRDAERLTTEAAANLLSLWTAGRQLGE